MTELFTIYPVRARCISVWLVGTLLDLLIATPEAVMTQTRMTKQPVATPTNIVVQSVFLDSNGGTLSRDIAAFLSPFSSSFVKRSSTCGKR